MKIKPLFLYILVIAVALIVILFYSKIENSESTETSTSNAEINDQQMPNDSVHAQFNQSSAPSSSNVSEAFKTRMRSLGEYVDKNPNDTVKVKEYADLLFAAHDPAKAMEYYKSILKKNPNRIDILMNLTLVNFNENNIGEAEKYTDQILQIDPDNLEANYNLGVIAVKKGNIELAREKWGKLVKNYPNTEIGKTAGVSLAKLNN